MVGDYRLSIELDEKCEGSLAPEASTLSGVILGEAWLGDAPAGRRCVAASHKVAFVRQR
jgi:hypothetical protein